MIAIIHDLVLGYRDTKIEYTGSLQDALDNGEYTIVDTNITCEPEWAQEYTVTTEDGEIIPSRDD